MWIATTSPSVSQLSTGSPAARPQPPDLDRAALERDRALGHARHADQRRRERRQAGERELVDLGRHGGAARVHPLDERPRRQVPDELAGRLDVAHGVLVADAGEADDRRRVVERVEEAVRREVQRAVRRARRDPADRPRPDDRVERVVRQAVAVLRLVGMEVVHQRRRVDVRRRGAARIALERVVHAQRRVRVVRRVQQLVRVEHGPRPVRRRLPLRLQRSAARTGSRRAARTPVAARNPAARNTALRSITDRSSTPKRLRM